MVVWAEPQEPRWTHGLTLAPGLVWCGDSVIPLRELLWMALPHTVMGTWVGLFPGPGPRLCLVTCYVQAQRCQPAAHICLPLGEVPRARLVTSKVIVAENPSLYCREECICLCLVPISQALAPGLRHWQVQWSCQWSDDVTKADLFFGRSWVRFRVPPWVSNAIAREEIL